MGREINSFTLAVLPLLCIGHSNKNVKLAIEYMSLGNMEYAWAEDKLVREATAFMWLKHGIV